MGEALICDGCGEKLFRMREWIGKRKPVGLDREDDRRFVRCVDCDHKNFILFKYDQAGTECTGWVVVPKGLASPA